jgi:hypothetical protein
VRVCEYLQSHFYDEAFTLLLIVRDDLYLLRALLKVHDLFEYVSKKVAMMILRRVNRIYEGGRVEEVMMGFYSEFIL